MIIATEGLTKRFGRVTAVDGVSLRVPAGVRFGLLGPNGSGKTTLVRMLLGLVHATSGSIEVLGEPMPRRASAVLPRVGALVEGPAAWGHLSGRANLRLLDAAGPGRARNRRRRVDEVLEQVGLGGVDRRPVRAYSLGMRQRLGIAAALLREPELLLLDEPTNGLDPRGIQEMRALLTSLNEGGTTVVLSSHLLPEVEALCTTVGVMDRGRLALTSEIAALQAPTGRILVRTPDPAGVVGLLDGQVVGRSGDLVTVTGTDPVSLNARLVRAGVPVSGLVEERRTLEQVVLELTGAGSDRVERRTGAGGSGSGGPGSGGFGSGGFGSGGTGPAGSGPVGPGSGGSGSGGPGPAGSGPAGPGSGAPGSGGPRPTGSGPVGPGSGGSGAGGPGPAGSGSAGSGPAGSSSAGPCSGAPGFEGSGPAGFGPPAAGGRR